MAHRRSEVAEVAWTSPRAILPPVDNETRLQPLSVRELLTATLTERPRITLHELERAAALQGHSSIEVEIVLNSLLRDRTLERVTVFQVRPANADPCPLDTEMCEVRTVSSPVDLAESAREVTDAAIAKAMGSRRAQAALGPRPPFWKDQLAALQALQAGSTHHLIHPDRPPSVVAKQLSVQLYNWRHKGQLPQRFKCRVSDQGVFVTRIG